MAGDPAELAFGHCLVVLGDAEQAAEVAAAALRRAGRSRSLVLAHARHQALLAADGVEMPDPAMARADSADPAAVARVLAGTRPAIERCVLDIRTRTGADRAALGRALGMTPTVAALRAAEFAEAWDRDLDPALLVLLGPGDCVELAEVLADLARETVADLMAAAPSVAAHVGEHEPCTDRLRAMASVRELLGRTSEPVPAEVRMAGRVNRRRRPSAVPPPLLGVAGAARARRGLVPALAALGAVIVGLIVFNAWPGTKDDTRVAALTKIPSRGVSLLLGPAITSGRSAAVGLANRTGSDVVWKAELSVPWAEARPARGTVPGQGRDKVIVDLLDTAPEGDVRAKLTVTGSDGSTAVAELVWTVERQPQIAATADGCEIKVSVVEDGELSSLVLHWRDTADREAPITEGPDGYTAALAPASVPLTWWITAADARGNTARSPDAVIAPGTC